MTLSTTTDVSSSSSNNNNNNTRKRRRREILSLALPNPTNPTRRFEIDEEDFHALAKIVSKVPWRIGRGALEDWQRTDTIIRAFYAARFHEARIHKDRRVRELTLGMATNETTSNVIEIPHEIQELTELVRLKITDLYLLSQPHANDATGSWLPNLRQLEIHRSSHGHFRDLPAWIPSMAGLKHLSLVGKTDWWNTDSISPLIGKLRNLEKLEVYGMPSLKEIPDEVGDLTKLTELSLKNCGIRRLPKTIGKLKNLERLSLFHAPLVELPEELGQLSNLNNLNLEWTNITGLPETIENLANIENLWLHGTSITALPPSLEKLPKLLRISFFDTPLTRNLGQEMANYLVRLAQRCPSLIHIKQHDVPSVHPVDPLPPEDHCRVCYMLACNRARSRKTFVDVSDVSVVSSATYVPKLWPAMLCKAIRAFRLRSYNHLMGCFFPKIRSQPDAIYALLGMGMDSFVGVLVERPRISAAAAATQTTQKRARQKRARRNAFVGVLAERPRISAAATSQSTPKRARKEADLWSVLFKAYGID